MSQYIPTQIQHSSTSSHASSGYLHKKQMPHIVTYLSDDEEDSSDDFDDEDSKPLAELRVSCAPFPASDYHPTSTPLLSITDPSNLSSSSDDDDDEEEIKKQTINAICDNMTIQKWLKSKSFQTLQRSSPQIARKPRIPHSFVVFFHESILPGTSDARSFREIFEAMTSEWKQLSPERRMEYRLRGINAKQSYARHLANHKAKLLALDSIEVPRCETIGCNKSVEYDPRWSLQHCSADCLLAHCKSVFARRFKNSIEMKEEVVDVDAELDYDDEDDEVEIIDEIPPHTDIRTLPSDQLPLQDIRLRDCSIALRQSDLQCGLHDLSSESFVLSLHSTKHEYIKHKSTNLLIIQPDFQSDTLKANKSPEGTFRDNLFERIKRKVTTTSVTNTKLKEIN